MMKSFDLILRGGTVVTPAGERLADLGVAEGSIVAVALQLSGRAREEIDARGLHIFPGLIDSHVHFNEPGRAHWEGIKTGSRALAAICPVAMLFARCKGGVSHHPDESASEADVQVTVTVLSDFLKQLVEPG